MRNSLVLFLARQRVGFLLGTVAGCAATCGLVALACFAPTWLFSALVVALTTGIATALRAALLA